MSTCRNFLTVLAAGAAVWCFSYACTGGDLLWCSVGTIASALTAAAINRRANLREADRWTVAFLFGISFMFVGGFIGKALYLTGPALLLGVSALVAGAVGLLTAYFCSKSERNYTFTARTLPLAAFVCAFLMPVEMAVNTKHKAATLKESANLVQRYGLSAFHKVDTNGDGVLTGEELDAYLASNALNEQEACYLSMIRAEMEEVGHVTSSDTNTVGHDDGDGNKIYVPVTTNTYGVSREDLISFPDRIEHKYRNW